MRSVLKWIGRILGVVVGLIVVAVAAVYIVSGLRINATYDVTPADIEIPDDAESIARGEHLATSVVVCTGCHGEDLSGTTLADDFAFGRVTSSNLTAGAGGVGGTYTDEDWLRAIRHGVRPDGSALLFMPAHEFNRLGAQDVASVIAYVKSAPPVDNVPADDRVGPLLRVLFLTGQFPLVPAELIDHDAPPAVAVEPGVTAEYGEYLTVVCRSCHREDLNGGPISGAPPDAPPAANLTQLGDWTEEDFFRVLREGVGPDGEPVNEFMPWEEFGNMEDDEIRAIWMYLQSLEPMPTGD